jgi:hypothetical protein
MLSRTIQRVVQQLPRRGFASSAVHHSSHHVAKQVATSLWIPMVGTAVAATVILFAPPYEFDDLDCQSHCQQVCTKGVCEEHAHDKDKK